MIEFRDESTLYEAREKYFQLTGFNEEIYTERWRKFTVGSVPIYFPNTRTQRENIWLHDLHHVLTGYEATWLGEAEIAAWELGSGGFGRMLVVWLLISGAIFVGLFINPRAVWKAYLRGRQTRTNLFVGLIDKREQLLSYRVGEIRRAISIPGH